MDRWHRSTWATVIGDRKKETEKGRKEKVCRTTEYTNSDQKGKKKIKTMEVMREKEIIEKEKALMEKQAKMWVIFYWHNGSITINTDIVEIYG